MAVLALLFFLPAGRPTFLTPALFTGLGPAVLVTVEAIVYGILQMRSATAAGRRKKWRERGEKEGRLKRIETAKLARGEGIIDRRRVLMHVNDASLISTHNCDR